MQMGIEFSGKQERMAVCKEGVPLENSKKLTNICVLSGHQKGLSYVREEATQVHSVDCFINTIEKSQGQEFDLFIIGLVKTEGDAEFVEHLGRACVATPRHKIAM